jgi:hypothetical protein
MQAGDLGVLFLEMEEPAERLIAHILGHRRSVTAHPGPA